MKFFRIASLFVAVALAACSESNSGDLPVLLDNNTDTTQTISTAKCDSVDISIFCVSINGDEKTLYVHTEDADSPLLANPFITGRFQTTDGITFTQVLFDITPTSFLKGVTVVFSGNSAGTYVMDGSGNFSLYTLAADQSWMFIAGFSSGVIEVTQYGGVGEYIRGSFSAALCDLSNATANGSDCSNVAYQIYITGNFNVLRENDV